VSPSPTPTNTPTSTPTPTPTPSPTPVPSQLYAVFYDGNTSFTSSGYTTYNDGSSWVYDSTAPTGFTSSKVTMSDNGTYMMFLFNLGGGNTAVYYSHNNNGTKNLVTLTPTGGTLSTVFLNMAASRNGRYVYIQANVLSGTSVTHIFKSTNYGATFTDIGPGDFESLAVSNNGQYVIIGQTMGSNGIYVSNNSGNTFTYVVSGNAVDSVSMSEDGQYMASSSQFQDNPFLYSTDYGVSFTAASNDGSAVARSNAVIAQSNDGSTILSSLWTSTVGKTFLSEDYGDTWTGVDNVIGRNFTINNNGLKIYRSSTVQLYKSTNYGASFSTINAPSGLSYSLIYTIASNDN
jgi:hypothetical protein